jgi:hypothetical protein
MKSTTVSWDECARMLLVRRFILPPPSGLRCKPSKYPARSKLSELHAFLVAFFDYSLMQNVEAAPSSKL